MGSPNVHGEINNVANSNAFNNDVSQVMIRLGISEAYLSSLLKAADIDFPGQALPEQVRETSPLSTKEIEVLRSGGARGLEAGPDTHVARVNSLQRFIEECQTLTEHSLNSDSVAKLLQISVSEVERDAQGSPPQLHGFKPEPGIWRFPAWQFTDAGRIPHLATVLAIVESRKPILLARFFISD